MLRAGVLDLMNDSELVGASLSGDRDAFGQIVARYQSLVCSLAYSATGNVGVSEDLAQETFVAAWKQLGQLRERQKLKAWLCGIARNCINARIRREHRQPLRAAESLEAVQDSASREPLPHEQAIRKEEEAILWRALGGLPETYREPLVLFYRQQQSTSRVAEALDLDEDTVRQRLSRGRKLLQEEVLAFVEGALEKTNPGKNFTIAVVAALPVLATSAKAAAIGATASKGGTAAKAAAVAMLANAFMSQKVVATHFDLAGRPNGWMSHSSFLWFGLATGVGVPLFLAAIGYCVRFLPVQAVNLPHRDYWLAPERRKETFDYVFHHQLWLACFEALFMLGLQLLVIEANRHSPPRLSNLLLGILTACFLAVVGLWMRQLLRRFYLK